MGARLWLLEVLLAITAVCGPAIAECNIHTAIVPASAAADHAASASRNEVQFSLSSKVEGNCPMIPDRMGEWSTSDPENTMISAHGLATCVNATNEPVTIHNSGMIRGRPYPPATLLCK
jgi:hypothetical protein